MICPRAQPFRFVGSSTNKRGSLVLVVLFPRTISAVVEAPQILTKISFPKHIQLVLNQLPEIENDLAMNHFVQFFRLNSLFAS